MLLGENIVLALRSLVSNKMRAFLTMLGIIIGIASVIAIFTVGNSLTLSVSENMQSLGANDIYVSLHHVQIRTREIRMRIQMVSPSEVLHLALLL